MGELSWVGEGEESGAVKGRQIAGGWSERANWLRGTLRFNEKPGNFGPRDEIVRPLDAVVKSEVTLQLEVMVPSDHHRVSQPRQEGRNLLISALDSSFQRNLGWRKSQEL